MGARLRWALAQRTSDLDHRAIKGGDHRVDYHGPWGEFGDSGEQPHVVVEVVENSQAQHHIDRRTLGQHLEQVADDERVAVGSDAVVVHAGPTGLDEMGLHIDRCHMGGPGLQRGEGEPAVVGTDVEYSSAIEDVTVGVDQSHVAGVQPFCPRSGLARVDEAGVGVEEMGFVNPR